MPALPTRGNARHFGALHLVSQPPPGLSHCEPKGLVSVDLRRACHHYTLLDQVFVNSDLHCTIPFVRTAADLSSGVRQRFDPEMAECGRGGHRERRRNVELLCMLRVGQPVDRRENSVSNSCIVYGSVADGRDGRDRVTFTSARPAFGNGKWRAFWAPITKSAHSAVSPWSAKPLTFTRWGNPLPNAWTVLFQRLPPRRHIEATCSVLLNRDVRTVIAMK
jgi:hypothetical protein